MKKKTQLLSLDMGIALLLTLLMNALAYYGTRLITTNRYHFDLTNPLDNQIPVVPWTASIYLGCYVFWAVNYVLGCRQDKQTAYQFISADFFAKVICLVCFVVFPTTNTRPELMGTGIWDRLLQFVYQADAADNLLPSIHCLTSWFCYIAVRKNKSIPTWYKMASLVITGLICISTLTTKQHVLIDVVAGVALAEASFWLVRSVGFVRIYRKVIMAVTNRIFGKKVGNKL